MTPSEEEGGGKRERRFLRALRLRMSEIIRNMASTRMNMRQAPTPIFTATFNRGPGGALLCVWLLAVALPDVVVEAGSVGEEEGEEDVGVESDA